MRGPTPLRVIPTWAQVATSQRLAVGSSSWDAEFPWTVSEMVRCFGALPSQYPA